jgi:kinesin family protein 23
MNGFELQSSSDASSDRQREQQRISNNQFNQNNPSVNATNRQIKQQAQNEMSKLNDSSPKIAQLNKEKIYSVFISCIEIYNNYIYDLLDEGQSTNNNNQASNSDQNKESKNLKEDQKGCMYIKDANEIEVKSTEEAFECMSRAQKKRVVAYTDLNSESSRSHSIFTIRIVQVPSVSMSILKNGSQQSQQQQLNVPVLVSQLSLVDLAGSERTKRTKNTGSRLKEAGSINSSLMALRNCMEVLRENSLNGSRKVTIFS